MNAIYPAVVEMKLKLKRYYGRVEYFFLHTFREHTHMLVYVQYLKSTNFSSALNERDGKFVSHDGEGAKEVIPVTSIDAGIGIVRRITENMEFFINRSIVLEDLDREDQDRDQV